MLTRLLFVTFLSIGALAGDEIPVVTPAQLGEITTGAPHFIQYHDDQVSGHMVLSTQIKDGKLIIEDETAVPKFNINERLTITTTTTKTIDTRFRRRVSGTSPSSLRRIQSSSLFGY